MGGGGHLAHGLGISDRGGEVAVEVEAAKQSAPAVVAVRRVGQAPRHEWLTLTINTDMQSFSSLFTSPLSRHLLHRC